jgi:hypothetical protein
VTRWIVNSSPASGDGSNGRSSGECLRAVIDQKLGIRRQGIRGPGVDRFPSLRLHLVEEGPVDLARGATIRVVVFPCRGLQLGEQRLARVG